MFVSDKYKFIFFHIPKTGGTGITTFLKNVHNYRGAERADPEPTLHHMSAQEYLSKHPDQKDYFKFAVTRNPWARVLSGFQDFLHSIGTTSRPTYHLNMNAYKGSTAKDSFRRFCKDLINSPWKDDVHFLPQVKFVYDTKGASLVDKVFKLENLEDSIMNCEELPCFKDYLGFIKAAPADTRPSIKLYQTNYSELYDNECKDIIYELYKEDVETFGYEFGK